MTEAREMKKGLVQATLRIRADQKRRLDLEINARGGALADVVRDNLDLAFAIKEELSKIVEGEYDENDPKNAPRLVHALLFRVEERILAALDNLSQKISGERSASGEELESNTIYLLENFINIIASQSEHPIEVWLGAFLEIVPRIELIGEPQMQELEYKGQAWLKEKGLFKKEIDYQGYDKPESSYNIAQE